MSHDPSPVQPSDEDAAELLTPVPDADSKEPAPHERPPVRTDDN